MSALLPERHPQQDLFIPDIFDALPFKNDQHTMEHPFFTISTQKDVRTVRYQRDGVNVILSPSAEWGLPTMMDKDILLYCGSLVMAEINKGNIPSRTMRFSCHDLMVTTNRETNGKAYDLLKGAFERLAGCLVTTNIKTNDVRQSSGFHLLESYHIVEKSHINKRMVRVEVTLPDWFFNALVGKEVLTLSRNYFRLRKPLERRLYELARKHCGKQSMWVVGLDTLHQKSGSRSDLNKFRFQLRTIIKLHEEARNKTPTEEAFPDYVIALTENDKVTFTSKAALLREETMGTPLEELPFISRDTIVKGLHIVEDAGTGWDYSEIRRQFTQQLINGFRPKNVNSTFIGFVKKKVANRP
jgi:plasmid replication initiation protein